MTVRPTIPIRLAHMIMRHGRWILGALLICLAALAAGIPQLQTSSDSRLLFDGDSPELRDLRTLDRTYSSAAGIQMMVTPPSGTAFEPDSLDALRKMTEDAWQLPHAVQVVSAANHPRFSFEDGDLVIERALPATGEITPETAAMFKSFALSSGAMRNRFLSEDASAYGLSVGVVLSGRPGDPRQEIADSLRQLTESWRSEFPGFDVHVTSGIQGGLALADAAWEDLTTLAPASFLAVAALLAFMLRSAAGVLSALASVLSGTVATLGIAGWTGVSLTAGTAISPLAVTVLVAASCVHMILSWARQKHAGASCPAKSALEENIGAITVTNLTTAFGFLCLNFAVSQPLREMGSIIAFGVLFGMVSTLVIVPLGLRSASSRSVDSAITSSAMLALADWTLRHRRVWLLAFPTLAVLSVTGILRIGFDDSLVRYFDRSHPFRQDTEAIGEKLAGPDRISFSFQAPAGRNVADPAFLDGIERFHRWLLAQPEIVSVASIFEALDMLDQAMLDGSGDGQRIADDREGIEQFLMADATPLPDGLVMESYLDADRTQTLVTAALRVEHSRDIRGVALRSEIWIEDNLPQAATRATGGSVAIARITQRNNSQMLIGFGVALVLVSATMALALRSIPYAAVSLVPNLLPAVLAFGLWGHTFGDLNLGSTVVTTMTFGIVVDDTVHFLMYYLHRRRAGAAPEEAVRQTFSVVGAAIIITTFALAAGFGMMTLSEFVINQHIGALSVFVIVFALLADLLLLPALLVTASRGRA